MLLKDLLRRSNVDFLRTLIMLMGIVAVTVYLSLTINVCIMFKEAMLIDMYSSHQ